MVLIRMVLFDMLMIITLRKWSLQRVQTIIILLTSMCTGKFYQMRLYSHFPRDPKKFIRKKLNMSQRRPSAVWMPGGLGIGGPFFHVTGVVLLRLSLDQASFGNSGGLVEINEKQNFNNVYISDCNRKDLGSVVQGIVSLTSPLRGQLVKCFTTL